MFQPLPVFVGLRYSLAREHGFFVSFITWVSLLGVALGVAILIVVLSVMNGLGSELRDRLLSLSAHATLSAGGAAIIDWRQRIAELKGAPGLVGAAPFLDTDAMLSRQPAMSGAIVRGIDPSMEASVSTIADAMREGKLSDLVPGENRIILGRMLAYQLEVGVGDTLTVMTPGGGDAQAGDAKAGDTAAGDAKASDATAGAKAAGDAVAGDGGGSGGNGAGDAIAGHGGGEAGGNGAGDTVAGHGGGGAGGNGAGDTVAGRDGGGAGGNRPSDAGRGGGNTGSLVPVLREFQVAGIFEVGLQEHDSTLALINLEDAQALRGLAGPTGIRLKFDDVLKAPVLARVAAARLAPGLQLRDWTQDNQAYFRAIRIEKTMMALILMLIVAVAVFNIAAALVMVVSDKRTDIAILRTLGLSPRGVLAVFMTQGVLIGWVGTALGVAAGLAVALHVPFLEQALDLHIMDPDVYYISTVPSETHSLDVAIIAVTALVLTFVATIYPALQAARTQPAEALRYE